MNKSGKLKKYEPIINLLYCVIGLVFFNAISQILIYPQLNTTMGENKFGSVLTILAVVAIVAGSFGVGANNSRLVFPRKEEAENGDYNSLLLIVSGVCCIIGAITLLFFNMFSVTNVIFLSLLMIVSVFRYYSDYQFKKSLQFLLFMIFYLFLGVGYIIGLCFFKLTGIWELPFLLGEVASLIFVLVKGNSFKNFLKVSLIKKEIWVNILSLSIAELIANLVMNMDRILLSMLIDGAAVTIYYAASLFGKMVALLAIPFSGVIIGYLAKYKGKITKKIFSIFAICTFVVGCIVFVCCIIASPFFLDILYPSISHEAKKVLLLATLAQVVFFCANVLMVMIIRFWKSSVQLIINIVYGVLFIAASIISIKLNGLMGFAFSAVIVNFVRILIIIGFGFIAISRRNTKISNDESDGDIDEEQNERDLITS